MAKSFVPSNKVSSSSRVCSDGINGVLNRISFRELAMNADYVLVFQNVRFRQLQDELFADTSDAENPER